MRQRAGMLMTVAAVPLVAGGLLASGSRAVLAIIALVGLLLIETTVATQGFAKPSTGDFDPETPCARTAGRIPTPVTGSSSTWCDG